MLQKKYHPIRPFNNRTRETYIEQVGIPMYEEAGFRFDIPNDKLLDRSWHYKPEDWVPNFYKNRQVTSNNDTNIESEVEEDEYDGESNFDSDKNESEVEEDDYDGESKFDSSNESEMEDIESDLGCDSEESDSDDFESEPDELNKDNEPEYKSGSENESEVEEDNYDGESQFDSDEKISQKVKTLNQTQKMIQMKKTSQKLKTLNQTQKSQIGIMNQNVNLTPFPWVKAKVSKNKILQK